MKQFYRSIAIIQCLVIVMIISIMNKGTDTIAIKMVTAERIASVGMSVCNNGISVTDRVALFSAVNNSDIRGSTEGAVKLLRRARLMSRVSFQAMILEVSTSPIPPNAREVLQGSGWQICTVSPLGSSDEDYNRLRMWRFTSIKTIVFIDPSTHIAGDITNLLNLTLPGQSRIGATLRYDEKKSDWSNSFGTQVFIFHPSTTVWHCAEDMVYAVGTAIREMTPSSGFLTISNKLFTRKHWYDIGFEYAADTTLIEKLPSFWEAHLGDIKIFTYPVYSLPWEPGTKSERNSWWNYERNISQISPSTSLYRHLWGRKVGSLVDGPQGLFDDQVSLTKRTSNEGLSHALPPSVHVPGPPAVADYDTNRIYSSDRRKKRVPLMFGSVHSDIFPDDAPPEKSWKILIGIPSIDTPGGASLREFQRMTCFRDEMVWNYRKRPDSRVLVKYFLGYHPDENYSTSSRIVDEGSRTKDIIWLNLREGQSAKPGELLFEKKPLSILIGMSRKTYAFFSYAADNYKTDYCVKSDDDTYLRIRVLLRELDAARMPRVFYGRAMIYDRIPGMFRTSGALIALSFDLVDWIRDSTKSESLTDFAFEDMLPGIWFYEGGLSPLVRNISDCRMLERSALIPRYLNYSSAVGFHAFKGKRTHQFFDMRDLHTDYHIPPVPIRTRQNLLPGEHVEWVMREMCPQSTVKKLNLQIPYGPLTEYILKEAQEVSA